MKTTTLIMLVCMAVVSAIPFCITGCGNEPDDQEIRTVGDLKKWVIEEIGFYVAEEAESRAKFDREVLDMIRTRERGAYDWKEENVIERIEIMERTWKLANTHEIKQDEEIKTLQEDNTFLSNKINRNTQQDWELIMAILDYLELEREYYQSDFKLVKKEKGMR